MYGKIVKCHNSAQIIGRGYTAGIAGRSAAGEIDQCYNTGNITGTGTYVAGIVGYNTSGTVNSVSIKSIVKNTYNIGNIDGSIYANIGGIVGYNLGTIQYSYNVGNVNTSSTTRGGIAGTNASAGTIENCYWYKNVSLATLPIGTNSGTATNVLELTIENMKKKASFIGFDFDTIWYINEDNNYPQLRNVR